MIAQTAPMVAQDAPKMAQNGSLDNLLPTAFLLCAVIIVLLVRRSTWLSVAESFWQSPMTQALLRKEATDDMNIFMLKLNFYCGMVPGNIIFGVCFMLA